MRKAEFYFIIMLITGHAAFQMFTGSFDGPIYLGYLLYVLALLALPAYVAFCVAAARMSGGAQKVFMLISAVLPLVIIGSFFVVSSELPFLVLFALLFASYIGAVVTFIVRVARKRVKHELTWRFIVRNLVAAGVSVIVFGAFFATYGCRLLPVSRCEMDDDVSTCMIAGCREFHDFAGERGGFDLGVYYGMCGKMDCVSRFTD